MEVDFFMTKYELEKLWETRIIEFKASGKSGEPFAKSTR
jgi:hypothetical protein